MKINRLIIIVFFSFFLAINVLPIGKKNTLPVEKRNTAIENISSNDEAILIDNTRNNIGKEDSITADKIDRGKSVFVLKSQKESFNRNIKSCGIIKGDSIKMKNGRRGYDLSGREISTKHFAFRVTTPDNPFPPHKHEQSELWFIISGKAKVLLDGIEYEVEENDLIIIDPWVEHGLKTDTQVNWICIG